MAAGKRDRLVNLYPVSVTEDSLGVEGAPARGTAVPAWAAITYGGGSERREAAQAGSRQTATFRVLSTSALRAADETWEIVDDLDKEWGVVAIAHVGLQQREIEFTAIRNGS